MKEILNKYLDRIILDILCNFSSLSREMGTLNYLESLVGEKSGPGGVGSKEINDMKLKFAKESTWGDILKICRDQMSNLTFDKILNDLLRIAA